MATDDNAPTPPMDEQPTMRLDSASSINLGETPQLTLGPPVVAGDLGSFGGYRVLRLLGRGGMGEVYLAVDSRLGRTVALKSILPDQQTDAGRERFLREARAAAAVRHDNVVTVYQVGEDAGVPFLAMEHLTGMTLAERYGYGPLPLDEVLRVGREVASGLAAAHAAGVVHRDVKPANIWLEGEPEPGDGTAVATMAAVRRAKLLDFGLAHVAHGGASLTGRGAVLGTYAFMAPEQATGDPAGPKSDLFALGVVLYQAVTGQLPFTGRSPRAMLDDMARNSPPRVSSLKPGVPTDLADLIHRLIAYAPGDRPAAAAEVADRLTAIRARELGRDPTPPPADGVWEAATADRGSAVGRRRGIHTAWAACAALVAAGLTIWIGLSYRAADPSPLPPVVRPPVGSGLPDGFTRLFNGTDLTGWHPPAGKRSDGWSVAGGAIVGTPVPGGSQWLLSDGEYDEFDLRLSYRWRPVRADAFGHTTIAFRAFASAAAPDGLHGLQINLRDEVTRNDLRRPENNLYRTGGLQGLTVPDPIDTRPPGEWNDLRVVVRKQRVRVEHNGKVTTDADLDAFADKAAKYPALARRKGSIALNSHVWEPVEFKAIVIGPPPTR